MSQRLRFCWAVAFLLFFSATAQAGLFDDVEARKQIEQLRTELADITARIETVSRNQLGFANLGEASKTDLAKLRGQIEVLTYELESAQKRQKDFYVDLDNRLRKLEQPIVDSAEKPATTVVDPASETRDYESALSQLKSSKFADAAGGFTAFIKTWPTSTMLASAHYWGGYAFSQAKEPAKAAELFGKFVLNWPGDERAPIALESQVGNLEAIKDTRGARAALELLATKYPSSEAGKRAKLRLRKK